MLRHNYKRKKILLLFALTTFSISVITSCGDEKRYVVNLTCLFLCFNFQYKDKISINFVMKLSIYQNFFFSSIAFCQSSLNY